MKLIWLGLLGGIVLTLCTSLEPSYAQDGESLFDSKCLKCHHKNGQASVVAPVKYASRQWERFFQRNKHRRKKDISNDVSPQETALIKQYLIDHAADSDRPIAAGIK